MSETPPTNCGVPAATPPPLPRGIDDEQYFLWWDGAEAGPYRRDVMHQMLCTGRLRAGAIYRASSSAEWREVNPARDAFASAATLAKMAQVERERAIQRARDEGGGIEAVGVFKAALFLAGLVAWAAALFGATGSPIVWVVTGVALVAFSVIPSARRKS